MSASRLHTTRPNWTPTELGTKSHDLRSTDPSPKEDHEENHVTLANERDSVAFGDETKSGDKTGFVEIDQCVVNTTTILNTVWEGSIPVPPLEPLDQ